MLAEIAKQKNPFLELHLTPMQVSQSFIALCMKSMLLSFQHHIRKLLPSDTDTDTAHATSKLLYCSKARPHLFIDCTSAPHEADAHQIDVYEKDG